MKNSARVHPLPNLAKTLAGRSSKIAVVDCESGRSLSYFKLAKTIDELSKLLEECSLSVGSRIMIVSTNPITTMICVLAAWNAQLVPVPVSNNFDKSTQGRVIEECEIRILICEKSLLSTIGSEFKYRTNFDIESNVIIATIQSSDITCKSNLKPDDNLALIVYTSGTTGQNKGVMLGAGSLSYAANSMAAVVEAQNGERALTPLNGSHLYGIIANCYLLSTEAEIYICDAATLGQNLISYVQKYEINAILIQPQHVKKLINTVPLAMFETVRYVACASGGVALSEATLLAHMFPSAHHFFYYALSEAPRAVFIKDPHRLPIGEIPLGRAAPGMHLTLDDRDNSQGNNLGEIIISGPAVAIGYTGDAEANKDRFTCGSFRTGDLGEEIDGEIFYRGRIDDLIEWRGVRVSAWMIELQLAKKLQKTATVVGLSWDQNDGIPVLHVIIEGLLTSSDQKRAKAIVKPIVERLNLPLRISAMLSLPRTTTGKILRNQALNVSRS